MIIPAALPTRAHLVGAIAGVSYAYALRNPQVIARIRQRIPGLKKKGSAYHSAPPRPHPQDRLSPEEIDHILDKIGKQGMGALTPRERELPQTRNAGDRVDDVLIVR